jgi:hypothetical protein
VALISKPVMRSEMMLMLSAVLLPELAVVNGLRRYVRCRRSDGRREQGRRRNSDVD